MKTIKTQKDLDAIRRVEKDEEVLIESSLRLNAKLEVFGVLKIKANLDCSWVEGRYVAARGNSSVEARGNSSVVAWENSSVVARENSSVEARGNNSVEAWENSSVVARGNSSVEARGNSSVVARGNSSVVAWENSSVVAWENSSVAAWGNSSVAARGNSSVAAWENSSVEAWENSSVEAWENSSVAAWGNSSVAAWENSSVEAWENSSVVARGNSSVVARGNSLIRAFSTGIKIVLHGFAVCFADLSLNFDFKIKSKFALIQRTKDLGWFEREGIEPKTKIIVHKRVSSDFKTQEGTENETLWAVGSVVTHKNWNPKQEECGAGKFHACSRPYFCDEFRQIKGDRYIAVQVSKKDLFEWVKNPSYPHKIGFRKGKVLFECDRFGREIKGVRS